MKNLQQISQHLKYKGAEGEVFTIPLEKSQQYLKNIYDSETKCMMLFTSSKNKDGKQWCPYCVNIKPYYNQYFEEVAKLKLPLFIFIAGDQVTWKNKSHPFRKDKKLQINYVPTFGFFNGRKLVNKIGGEQMVIESQRKIVYETVKQF